MMAFGDSEYIDLNFGLEDSQMGLEKIQRIVFEEQPHCKEQL